jgi:predicted RNase H-like HicB family nuclease
VKQAYTAIVKKDAGWWIGWIEELPGVNCQARTRDALRRRLKATLEEALEMNREEARSLAGDVLEEELIEV